MPIDSEALVRRFGRYHSGYRIRWSRAWILRYKSQATECVPPDWLKLPLPWAPMDTRILRKETAGHVERGVDKQAG